MIDKEFRKVTISNPGTFRISIDEAIAGGISDARNGRIFNMFYLINVGERSGTGLCDVYHIWRENGFKEPELIETVDPDRITITLQIEIDGNLDGNDSNLRDNLSKNERLVLQALSTNPELSAEKIGKQVGISKSSVERALRSLKKKKIIIRQGSTRGKWII